MDPVISNNVEVIGIALSVSAILSAASAFLLGFYIPEKKKGSILATPYKNLVVVLAIPSLIIGFPLFYLVLQDTFTFKSFVLLISIGASLIPPIAFLLMIK